MEQLDPIFERWGYIWTVIVRTKEWVLLCQQVAPDACNYNVCKIKQGKGSTFPNGKTYPPKEELPSAEQWGRLAWNYGPNLERAKAKYNKLTK